MIDKKYRAPRIWSNRELEKFAGMFDGKVINVSAWQDMDKEGRRYKEYFTNHLEYWITNFKSETRGFQGDMENEIFLDLSAPLPEELEGESFDVVFNHTVLEHVFEIDAAFRNLCLLSKDIVVVVVPFLQEQHADYGDYWRFTPQALDRLFEKNGLKTIYINFNDSRNESIYVFGIGSRNPSRWNNILQDPENKLDLVYEPAAYIGTKIIRNSSVDVCLLRLRSAYSRLKRVLTHSRATEKH